MRPEAQRIAIAEACGWKFWHRPSDETLLLRPDERWPAEPYWQEKGFVAGDGRPDCPIVDLTGLPDYLNDLNAMHEAEKVLNWSQKNDYRRWLEALWRTEDDADNEWEWHATAAQRAEAFLRTLGLWQD